MKSENMTGRLESDVDGSFVVIADIELKEGVEEEFIEWFFESNRNVLSKIDGFVDRKLLKSPDGRFRIILTCTSRESFQEFYQSKEHMAAHQKALSFMSKPPQMSPYQVVSARP